MTEWAWNSDLLLVLFWERTQSTSILKAESWEKERILVQTHIPWKFLWEMPGMGLCLSHFFKMSSKLSSLRQGPSAHRLRSSCGKQTGPRATLCLCPVFLLNTLKSGNGTEKAFGESFSFAAFLYIEEWGSGSSWRKSKASRSQWTWQSFVSYYLWLNLSDVY